MMYDESLPTKRKRLHVNTTSDDHKLALRKSPLIQDTNEFIYLLDERHIVVVSVGTARTTDRLQIN